MSELIGQAGARSGIVGKSMDTAKAWLRYSQPANNLKNEFGVSTVADNATGYFTVNFKSTQVNADYAVVGMSKDERYLQLDASVAPTTTAFKVSCTHHNSYFYDVDDNNIIVFGD